MRKNGFTLIELLAVIVILAIIALIATPIILGIINDASEKANERSVELYAAAVKNGIAAYQLMGTNVPKSFEDLTIQYDGDVKCTVQELYEDGSFYLEGCKVNNGDKEYSYGTKQSDELVEEETPDSELTPTTKKYYFDADSGCDYSEAGYIEQKKPDCATESLSNIDTKLYMKLDVDSNDVVTEAYVCFTTGGAEYCLIGDDPVEYDTNVDIFDTAFSSCYFDDEGKSYSCSNDEMGGYISSKDGAGATAYIKNSYGEEHIRCYISGYDKSFTCNYK